MDTFEDPIVNEVRETRRHYAERYDYDLNKIVAALQAREREAKDIVHPRTPSPASITTQQK